MHTIIKTIRFMICIGALVILLGTIASSQEKSIHRQLLEQQIRNEQAQAEYYRAQTEKMQASQPKTLSGQIQENPVPIIAASVSALAALIAFISFLFNYRSALRNQRDTQFYEALKRLGDPESPATRASAAVLLSQMARGNKRSTHARGSDYFDTARDALLVSVQIEENPTALEAIRHAFTYISYVDPCICFMAFRNQNIAIQKKLLNALVYFCVLRKNSDPDLISENVLREASLISVFISQASLRAFIERWREDDNLAKRFRMTCDKLRSMTDEERTTCFIEIERQLELQAVRLITNSDLFTSALRDYSKLSSNLKRYLKARHLAIPDDMRHIFLHGGRLENAEISYSNFKGAQFTNIEGRKADFHCCDFTNAFLEGGDYSESHFEAAEFSGACLSGIAMRYAHLNGARFDRAVLGQLFEDTGQTTDLSLADISGATFRESHIRNVRMFKVKHDDKTVFPKDWHRVDYSSTPSPLTMGHDKIDEDLLKVIVPKDQRLIDSVRSDAHPSVLKFLEQRAKDNAAQSKSAEEKIQPTGPAITP